MLFPIITIIKSCKVFVQIYVKKEHIMGKLNVAIADDNEKVLHLLKNVITEDKDLELVGQANNGEEIYQIIKSKKPDVVLLDIIMPKMDGLSVMERINNDDEIKNRPSFIIISALA